MSSISLALLLLVAPAIAAIPVAARSAPPRSHMPRVHDAAAAEARYREWHRSELAPTLSDVDRRRADGLLARSPGVKRWSCRAAPQAVAATGTPSILRGSLAALDRDGECWVLRWDGLLAIGLGAVVAEDGEIVLAWWIPEG